MGRTYINWSGGKDCAMALYHMTQKGEAVPELLLTSINSTHNRISMHGVRRELLIAQARLTGMPLQTIELPEQPSMKAYETRLQQTVGSLQQAGYITAVFGDIFLEDLRKYREDQLLATGIQPLFPLWKKDTRALLHEMLALGFKTIVVCVNEQWLDKSFCGRIIDEQFIADLPANVDPCGENGEFHTFVFDGPVFKQPVQFTKGEMVYKAYNAPASGGVDTYGFWFCDLLPSSLG